MRFGFERPLIVLQWLVGFVLLIACTNVANLLLARAWPAEGNRDPRRRGRRRVQLFRQLLWRACCLQAQADSAGLILSAWVAKGLVRFLPYDPANISLSTTPDLRVLLFTAAVVLMTAIVFGMVPAAAGFARRAWRNVKDEAGSVAGGHSPRAAAEESGRAAGGDLVPAADRRGAVRADHS